MDTDIQRTLEFYKGGGAPAVGALSPDIQKDLQISTGAAGTPGGTGLQAYNLLPAALTLYPVLTPVRNMLPRLQGRGKQSEFKAILGVSGATAQNVWGAEGASGQKVDLVVEDVVALYRSLKLAAGVSFEQQWAGQGFIDSKATAVVNLLRQFMLREEQAILFGANSTAAKNQFAGGAVGTPATLADGGTVAVGATVAAGNVAKVAAGGALANVAHTVQISAVTGMGESIASLTRSQTPAASGQLVVTPPLRGTLPVLYWNIYVTASATTYLIRTNGPAVQISDLTAANGVGLISTNAAGAAVVATSSSSGNIGTSLAATVFGGSIPAADNSASASAYNGLVTQIYGSTAASDGTYTWAGVGQPGLGNQKPGASVVSANGTLAATGTGNSSIENFLALMWNNANADPQFFLANQTEARSITKQTLGSGTPYYVVPAGAQNDATANFRVSRFTNPVTGSEVEIKVHPQLTQGTIIAGSNALPDWYVPTDVPAPMALDCLQDYLEVDYPPVYNTSSGGDTWVVQIMNMATFKLFVPAIFGAMDGIIV